MAEQRLIDANALIDTVEGLDWYHINKMGYLVHGANSADHTPIYKAESIYHAIENAPTVNAVVLPCKIGDDVYIIPSKVNFDLNILSGLEKNNRVYHQKVAEIVFTQDCWYVSCNADKEYGTGRTLIDRFYKETWFLTREEAEAALDGYGL